MPRPTGTKARPTGTKAPYEKSLIPGDRQIYNTVINEKVVKAQEEVIEARKKVTGAQKDHLIKWQALDKNWQQRLINEVIRDLDGKEIPKPGRDDVEASLRNRWTDRKYDETTRKESSKPLPYDPVRDAVAQQNPGPNLEG